MRKKFTLALSMLMMAGLAWDYNNQQVHSNSSGAPAGRTGSPGDGESCFTGCHGMSPGSVSGNETVTLAGLPAGGYAPGTTYALSITTADPGVSMFGFQLSPQDDSGTILGTLIAGTGSQLVGSGSGWLTHDPAGTTSGSKTWDFQWTAPVAGTGDVTFYHSSIFADGAQGNNGDVIVTGNETVTEDLDAAINDLDATNLTVYPNPVVDRINIAMKDVDEEIMLSLYGTDGRMVYDRSHTGKTIQLDVDALNLDAGVYFLRIEVAGNAAVRKLLID